MATLTDPIDISLFSDLVRSWTRTADGPAGGGGRGAPAGSSGRCRSGLGWRLCRRVPLGGAVVSTPLAVGQLAVDELGQPADLTVDGVQTVALQLEGVAVQPLAGPAQRGPQALALPLDGAAAALESSEECRGGNRGRSRRRPSHLKK